MILITAISSAVVAISFIYYYSGGIDGVTDTVRLDRKMNEVLKNQASLASKVATLISDISEQSNSIEATKKALSDTEAWVLDLDQNIKSKNSSTALLDPRNKSYSPAVSWDNATFLFIIKSAKPYLDGQMIVLGVGNPQSVSYSLKRLHVTWGTSSRFIKDEKRGFLRIEGVTHSKTIDIPIAIIPAKWNDVQFSISPVKDDQFEYLNVTPEFDSVWMP